MPAYSFQKQFVSAIERGDKTHTIRAKRKARPAAGQRCVGYYAMRTKQCRKLFEAVITRVQDITISDHDMIGGDFMALYGLPLVIIDGDELDRTELEALAKRDGFVNAHDFWKFWQSTHSIPFRGDIIHWCLVGQEVAQ